MSLQIGKETSLPPGLFNKRLGILAMQGAGKTYAVGVLEEEMLDYIGKHKDDENNAKIIIIDPVGAHWGIRSHFPIHIVGGEHSDMDLDPDSGKLFGEMVDKFNLSMLFDLSQFEQDDMTRFVTDFLNKLFQITKTPTHVILEEADMFAPQRGTSKFQKFSLAAVDSVVRRGRGRGLGVTMITQRPAVLNKNVLTQVDASIILNITGERDLDTIREYLSSAGSNRKEIANHIEKIMKFKKGQGLLFSPSWLETTKIINIRQRVSFHSGAEPELGKVNPADSIKLIKMNIQPIIEYLNGDKNIKLDLDTSVRENKWSGSPDSVFKDFTVPEQINGPKNATATIIVLVVSALFTFAVLSFFS